MTVNLIAAVGRRGQVCRHGALPWLFPADLAWLRATTMGGIVICGRPTWSAMPAMPALPGSRLMLWRDHPGARPSDVATCLLADNPGTPIWIAGGPATWRAFAPLVDGLKLISLIDYDSDPADDAQHDFFPFDAFALDLSMAAP